MQTTPCSSCAEWNEPHAPVQIFGNTYFVGTNGLSAILVTSPEGHFLIDGALPESASQIAANITTLGFRLEDVRWIVNSHAHYDHAGGIASLQNRSGARVAASPQSAVVLEKGISGAEDPQDGLLLPFPAVDEVYMLADGEVLRVGTSTITAHFTPGHTAGGTSWSWRSCEGEVCLDLVYADSLTPVSADDFLFSRNEGYPSAVDDFAKTYRVLEQLPCDILLAPHPSSTDLWARFAARDQGDEASLIDTEACGRYAAKGRRQLDQRLEREAATNGL